MTSSYNWTFSIIVTFFLYGGNMFKVKDYVIYKRDLCIVKEIKEKFYNNKDYYVLTPISDDSLTIKVPSDSKDLKHVISKEETLKLIKKIPDIEIIESNDRLIENEYRTLLHTNNHEDLIKIIKTTYLRNEERRNLGKKIGDKDNDYFKKAEKYLYNELAVSLNMTYDECKDYIISEVEKLIK